jgi:hypothetical protein
MLQAAAEHWLELGVEPQTSRDVEARRLCAASSTPAHATICTSAPGSHAAT